MNDNSNSKNLKALGIGVLILNKVGKVGKMEPELTQAMKDYAVFMETYVEPAFYFLHLLGIGIAPAVLGLINFVGSIVMWFLEVTGYYG